MSYNCSLPCEYHMPDSTVRVMPETLWRPEQVVVNPECCFRYVDIEDCPRIRMPCDGCDETNSCDDCRIYRP